MAKSDIERLYKESSKKYSVSTQVDFLSTGDVFLDNFLCGGIPKSKVTVVSAPSGTGKSTLILWIAKYLCSIGHHVLYLDPEHAVTDHMLEGIGVQEYVGKQFLYYKNRTYKDIDDLMIMYLRGKVKPPSVVVIDSAPAIINDDLDDDDKGPSAGTTTIGWQAKPLGNFFNRWKGKISESNCALIVVNQARKAFKTNKYEKMSYKEEIFGGLKPWGGEAMNFYSDVRLWLDPGTLLTDSVGRPYGRWTSLHCTKTKVGRMGKIDLTVTFCEGVDTTPAVFQLLEQQKLLKQPTKGWFSISEALYGSAPRKMRKTDVLEWIVDNQEDILTKLRDGGFLDED